MQLLGLAIMRLLTSRHNPTPSKKEGSAKDTAKGALKRSRPYAPTDAAQERKAQRLAIFFHGNTTPSDGFNAIQDACTKNPYGIATRRYPEYPEWLPRAFHRNRMKEYFQLQTKNWKQAGKQILLIGHGRGGLLARMAVEEGFLLGLPVTLITLGTPHQPLLGNLPTRNERYRNIPFLNVWSTNDRVVPQGRSFHPQATNVQVAADHCSLLWHEYTITHVLQIA